MIKYIARRCLQAIPLLIIITIISFLIINMAPGDPVNMYINPETKSTVDLDAIRHEFGLDKPLYVRYFVWVSNMLKGNFGESYYYRRPVWDVLKEALPNTITLSFFSMLVGFLIAVPAGIICGVKKNSIFDYFFSTISFLGISMPGFWLALMLILVFNLKLGWLPSSGMRSNFEQFDLIDRIRHFILPLVVMFTGELASNLRYARGAMLDVINQDYIRTARSKGLSKSTVIFKHALRNALLPIITMIGFMIPGLISGAAIVESIFSWPGIGRILIEANFTRDYPIIMAELVIASILVVLGSLVADILYAVADPRIKFD